jgi:hypothetical protein
VCLYISVSQKMSRSDERSSRSQDASSQQAVMLFERAMSKVEKNMGALALLMEHFERSGFDKTKYSAQFQDMMGKFAKLMKEYTRTEYEYEGPYNAEQTQERYKASVTKSWKHKPERPENAEVPITEDEIKRAMQERAEKLESLQAKRAQQALLEGVKEKPMIMGPDGKLRYDAIADAESSDEDDDQLINRVITGDPNPGKHDTAKLKAAHLARLKNESTPVSKRLEHVVSAPARVRNTALADMLKAKGGEQFQEYNINELEDVHSMQKGFLAELGSDEDEDPASKFGKRASKARGTSAIKRTEEEMVRRQARQTDRDRRAEAAKARAKSGDDEVEDDDY